MRRPALVFLCAVLLPGLILAGLALRSIQHHEAILDRERGRLNGAAAERLAHAIAARLDEHQRDFSLRVESLFGKAAPLDIARNFDQRLRGRWPLASVGFAVSLQGEPLSPQILDGPEARQFLVRNEGFLCRQSSVEVFAVTPKGRINLADLDASAAAATNVPGGFPGGRLRFAQLVGDSQEGALARFLDDELVVWMWYRTPREPALVFGAQLDLAALKADLGRVVLEVTNLPPGVALALLDERDQPVATTSKAATADWSRAVAASPVGQALPHWRVAATVFDPAVIRRESRWLWLALTSVVVLLVGAIAAGGWLVTTDARRQLDLARRKSDFVSNVSHELRTPLTSIRLFAEMLAEERVEDPERRRKHLGVIQVEAARLHRLINHVLDFARLERGERPLRLECVDLTALVRQGLDTFGPQFASEDMRCHEAFPEAPLLVSADADALSQVLNNLLSNAVKYASAGGEVSVRLQASADTVLLEILDRGPGVPPGCEQRIFDEFFRAHDSLASAIPGAGLGLSLARHLIRAHGGTIDYAPREGGGSCFRVRLPRVESPGQGPTPNHDLPASRS